ncbi:MAG TPA: hypothetical protein VK932_26020, partial [Kofleriaceae bacterium]|nr:hypothetical protein [Kofleriaceae bacterium]
DNVLTTLFAWQTVTFREHLTLHADVRVVLESDGEDRRYYSDFPHRGIYLRQLWLRYERGPLAVFGGRYEPALRLRSRKPIFFGNYSTNLDLYGQLGGGASLTLKGGDSRHALTAHAFRRDTSRLRGEILRDRARDHDVLGEVGEYGPPDSYMITADGSVPVDEASVGYALGGGSQTRGMLRNQDALFANLFGEVPLAAGHRLYVSGDAMYLRDAGGQAEDRTILGAGLGYRHPRAYVGAAYSVRFVEYTDAAMDRSDRTDRIVEVVARYAFTPALTTEAAYQRTAEWHTTENAFGIALKYAVGWRKE